MRYPKVLSNAGIQLGDIFVSSGGYDQTNVEALQVVKLVGKSAVEVRVVALETVTADRGMCDTVKPVKDKFLDEGEANYARYMREKGGRRRVINGRIKGTWGTASKWDGASDYYRSWYA